MDSITYITFHDLKKTVKSKTEKNVTGSSTTSQAKPATDSATTRGFEFVAISNSSIDQSLFEESMSDLETTDGEIRCSDDDSNGIENVSSKRLRVSLDHDYVSNQLEDTSKTRDLENLNTEKLSTPLHHDYVSTQLKDAQWKIYMRKALVEQKQKYEKKISILMQQTRRQKKQIATLSRLLNEFKKK